MIATARRAVAPLLAACLVLAPPAAALAAGAAHGEVQAEAAPGGHHVSSKVRAAAEDHHWWLGQELIPVSLRDKAGDLIGPSWINGDPGSTLNVGHIFIGILAFIIALGLIFAATRKLRGQVLPPKTWSAWAFFDVLIEALLSLMESMMPREKALRFLPLVTSFAVFILISNVLGLVPGLVPPTQSLNTTLALGLVSFLYYNYQGIRTHGVANYIKHFMGPFLPLAPLIFVIELISHFARPASLALRLMGNMFGDHQVLFIFMSFSIPLIPLPLMALGLLVCIVQTLVFTLLTIVYLALAVEEHDHDHAGDHAHAAAH